jgi:hypothetical protein
MAVRDISQLLESKFKEIEDPTEMKTFRLYDSPHSSESEEAEQDGTCKVVIPYLNMKMAVF